MTDQTEWLTVAEAAQRLSISARAVQMRVAAGTLVGRKDGKRLLVAMPMAQTLREEVERDREDDEDREGEFERLYERVARRLREEREGEAKEREADLRAQIAQLEGEVAFLRAQLEQRDQAEAELRRLMLADKAELVEQRQRLAITAGEANEARTERNGFWRKLLQRR